MFQETLVSKQTHAIFPRVRGLMAINVGYEFRDRGSITSVFQITDADLGQFGLFKPQFKQWPPPRLAMRYWGGLHLVYKIPPPVHK